MNTATAQHQPAKLMAYHEFRRANPAIRCFQKYTSDQRSNHSASHRLTQGQRAASGEFFYTHPMLPNLAFPTAKSATVRAYAIYIGPPA